jgi:hypothetical protein
MPGQPLNRGSFDGACARAGAEKPVAPVTLRDSMDSRFARHDA